MDYKSFDPQPQDVQREPDFGRPEPMGPQSVDAQPEFTCAQSAPEAPVQPAQPAQPVQQPYQAYQAPQQPYYVQPQAPKQSKGMAIASMVLGICSIVFFSTVFISLICAIVGLVLGIVAKKKNQGGMATAGIVTSIIGIVIVVIVFVFAVLLVGEAFNQLSYFYY